MTDEELVTELETFVLKLALVGLLALIVGNIIGVFI